MVLEICLAVSLLTNVGCLFALLDQKLVKSAETTLKTDVEKVISDVKKVL